MYPRRVTPSDEPVLLLTTQSDVEAEMIRSLLASYDISSSVVSTLSHSLFPFAVGGLSEIHIRVPAHAEADARRIVAAHRSAAPEAAAEAAGNAPGSVVALTLRGRAPARIDLAGGTLDIWPIYLLLDDPVTVNVAIDLAAEAEVGSLSGSRVEIRSEDLAAGTEAAELGGLPLDGPLALAVRLVRHFAPQGGLRLTTRATVPAGSGLGGSSALAVAVATALLRRAGNPARPADAADLARLLGNLEAQVLGIPTGVQDYYPALLGGTLALSFSAAGVRAERLPVEGAALEERLVLAYEGASRSSGISNGDMLRRFLAGESGARQGLAAVARCARRVADALSIGDLDAAGLALDDEMTARRSLSPLVVTEATEAQFAAARAAGALGAKVCGAGGGGCSVYFTRAGGREAVATALNAAGARVLPFRIASSGALTESSQAGAPGA